MSKRLPTRGEVWLVNFDPTIRAEIRKTRPAVVMSSNAVGKLPIKLVAPLTEWKAAFAPSPWLVRVDPDALNALSKPSAADVLQLRGVDVTRFVARLGHLSPALLDQVAAAVGSIVEVP